MKKLYTVFITLLCVVAAQAQVSVTSRLDSAQILVGSQAHLTVTVSGAREGANIEFPSFKDESEIAPGLEVVATHDPSASPNIRVYDITAWDEGQYNAPALTVKVDGKSYTTKTIPLKVNTISVDTTHADSIRPMRGVAPNPYSWDEWSPLFWLSILLLALLVVAYYLYVRLRGNKPIIAHLRLIRRIPPHERALKKIEAIKSQQLSGPEGQKEYYTELTDALRQYLEERFNIRAKEMTSSEIIYRLEKEQDKSKIDELRQVFETADLVKFAKYSVQENTSGAYLSSVVRFIDSTKEENAPTVEKVGSKLSEKDKMKMRKRKGVRLAIALLIIAAVAIFAYVCWRIFEIVAG